MLGDNPIFVAIREAVRFFQLDKVMVFLPSMSIYPTVANGHLDKRVRHGGDSSRHDSFPDAQPCVLKNVFNRRLSGIPLVSWHPAAKILPDVAHRLAVKQVSEELLLG